MKIFLVIGIVFSPIAAAMAFLITYGEYTHHYPDKKMPLKLAGQAAIFTFIVFMAIMFGVGYFMNQINSGS